MTHTPIKFRPVPAAPIVVLSDRKGAWLVRTTNGVFAGTTLRAALEEKVAA